MAEGFFLCCLSTISDRLFSVQGGPLHREVNFGTVREETCRRRAAHLLFVSHLTEGCASGIVRCPFSILLYVQSTVLCTKQQRDGAYHARPHCIGGAEDDEESLS